MIFLLFIIISIFLIQTWETRYILLLWLAIVCIIPFDLKKLDGASVNDDESVLNRVLKSAIVSMGFSLQPVFMSLFWHGLFTLALRIR